MVGRPKGSTTKKAPSNRVSAKTLVLDNGAHEIKAGFSDPSKEPSLDDCSTIPNCIARSQRDKLTYVGAELYDCADYGELAFRRPVEKGFVTNWEGEKAIWEKSFFDKNAALHCDPHETDLILTEAPNAPAALQRNADEMVFEEFEFAHYYRTAAPLLNAYGPSPFQDTVDPAPGVPMPCLLVVDVGHSYTTVTPMLQGRPLNKACKRLDVGGKMLTNHLKDLVSRTFDIHKEDWIAMEIKEDVCYVSQSFKKDVEAVWKGGIHDRREVDTSIVVDYVLPDYEGIKRGYYRPHDPKINLRNRALGVGGGPREHIVTIGNERFVVPELLFSPSDIGMQQTDICGTILQSLETLPEGLMQPFLANILVVGGSSQIPGLMERLESELRSQVDEQLVVRIARASDPVKNTWLGGARLAHNRDVYQSLSVTRQEYLENGELWVRRKFAGKVNR